MRTLFAFLACFILVSCREDIPAIQDQAVYAPDYAVADTVAVAIAAPAAEVAYSLTSKGAPANLVDDVTEQKIIREATLRFETSEMDSTYNRTVAAVKKYGAEVQNDAESKNDESISRNMTIRIPSGKFDAFLTDIGKGVAYFDRKEISSSDVTEQYIDTDARLKAKKKLEARYLELLSKANKVSEMLEIEEKLSNVREDIEAKEGQLRYMQSRVAMSTVNLEFYKEIAAESGVRVSYGSKIWNAVKSGFNGISSFFLGLVNMWPIITILVVLILWLRRKFRKRKNP
jgi:hypothetical protein